MPNIESQHEITAPGALLDENGALREPGWARRLLPEYRRKSIKAAGIRIKEWDYYLIYNNDFGLALTVADNSYMSLLSASLLDFSQPWEQTTSLMDWFTFGKLALPESSAEGVTAWSHGNSRLAFEVEGGTRKLFCYIDKFKDRNPFYADVTLYDEPAESMVIATPYAEDKKAFYYNQKILCMKAVGKMEYRGKSYQFRPENSVGILDWGRGVWTYKNTWYWGAASGSLGGAPFGFNIGYGFGDTSAASENMLIYDGKAHKLDRLTFNIPQKDGVDDFMSPWTFTSSDGRFEMDFAPIIDRASKTNAGIICSDQHQIFGRYTGKAVLDDGTALEVKDMLGFAEKVYNKW